MGLQIIHEAWRMLLGLFSGVHPHGHTLSQCARNQENILRIQDGTDVCLIYCILVGNESHDLQYIQSRTETNPLFIYLKRMNIINEYSNAVVKCNAEYKYPKSDVRFCWICDQEGATISLLSDRSYNMLIV